MVHPLEFRTPCENGAVLKRTADVHPDIAEAFLRAIDKAVHAKWRQRRRYATINTAIELAGRYGFAVAAAARTGESYWEEVKARTAERIAKLSME